MRFHHIICIKRETDEQNEKKNREEPENERNWKKQC